jgi:hypothetical protein
VVFIVNMEIGYLAPPIATNLFVAASIFRKPFGLVTRAVLPTLAILCAGLLLITYVPSITVGPVHALRGESFWRPFAQIAPAKAPTATPAAGVMSLEEMMKLAKQRRKASPDGGAAP